MATTGIDLKNRAPQAKLLINTGQLETDENQMPGYATTRSLGID